MSKLARQLMIPLVALATVLSAFAGLATAGDRIFTLKDARGDDDGDGSFLYPETADLERGDLDITRLRATRAAGGTEFEATFARRVKQPERRPTEGYQLLTDLARYGFFNLNVDIYIDIDRRSGSGRVATLPGRLAEVHPDFAWEKAICLTPRPDTSRALLRRIMVADAKREIKAEKGTVRRADVDVAKEQIAIDVADDVFFPERIRVAGSTIRFFVPDTFLGGTARADWAYTVAVSGTDLMVNLQTADVSAGIVGLKSGGLMILPITSGGSRYTFGSREPDVEMLPPLADLIVPDGASQEQILRSFDVLAEQPAQLLGVVPGE